MEKFIANTESPTRPHNTTFIRGQKIISAILIGDREMGNQWRSKTPSSLSKKARKPDLGCSNTEKCLFERCCPIHPFYLVDSTNGDKYRSFHDTNTGAE